MTKSKTKIVAVPHPDSLKEGQLKDIGGSRKDEWNQAFVGALLQALPTSAAPYKQDVRDQCQVAAVVGLGSCNISDPIEAMLVGQMISANAISFELQRRAWVENQTFECRTKYLALADKAARTLATLSEALNRHRGKGQSTVVVKHVTVNAEQAIVADNITAPATGGVPAKNEDQPHAKQIANASEPKMPRTINEERIAVPSARRERA